MFQPTRWTTVTEHDNRRIITFISQIPCRLKPGPRERRCQPLSTGWPERSFRAPSLREYLGLRGQGMIVPLVLYLAALCYPLVLMPFAVTRPARIALVAIELVFLAVAGILVVRTFLTGLGYDKVVLGTRGVVEQDCFGRRRVLSYMQIVDVCGGAWDGWIILRYQPIGPDGRIDTAPICETRQIAVQESELLRRELLHRISGLRSSVL